MPILFFNIVWWKVLIGFFVMHYTAGLILSLVFQLAHVIGEADMPLPDLNTGIMKNSWVVHQMKTTVNFSTKNRIVNWFTGGLNHQIEHHIFPHISHIHYSKISAIVKKTAREFNLPYNEYKTTRAAIIAHPDEALVAHAIVECDVPVAIAVTRVYSRLQRLTQRAGHVRGTVAFADVVARASILALARGAVTARERLRFAAVARAAEVAVTKRPSAGTRLARPSEETAGHAPARGGAPAAPGLLDTRVAQTDGLASRIAGGIGLLR